MRAATIVTLTLPLALAQSDTSVRTECAACCRMLDNLGLELLPSLSARRLELLGLTLLDQTGGSKSSRKKQTERAKSASVGELSEVIEDGMEKICQYPRTHLIPKFRRACNAITEAHLDTIVESIADWAKLNSYGHHMKGQVREELRAPICQEELGLCTDDELAQQIKDDTAEDEEFEANKKASEQKSTAGAIKSEAPLTTKKKKKPAVLVRVTADDFLERVVNDKEKDFVLYLYNVPNSESAETHVKFRPKFVRLAEFLNAPASNGTLVVGWMDCSLNTIPHPHGTSIVEDKVVIYPANAKTAPRFWTDLHGGDVEAVDLVNFVHDASRSPTAQKHIRQRADDVGDASLGEAMRRNLLTFEQVKALDERTLKPLDLKKIKDEL